MTYRVMRNSIGSIVSGTTVLLLAAALHAQESARLAEIGGQAITVAEFQMVMNAMRRSGSVETALETLTETGREVLLNALVEKQLYAIGAREEGFDRQADVRFWIDQAATEILARKYLEAKADEVVVTDAALQAFYQTHPDLFVTPGRVKVRHILVRSREEADAILRDAAAGKDFATLAAERSTDAGTREHGGDLGWLTRGIMVKPFEDLVFSLQTGTIGGPVATSLGFHVVKLDDVEAPVLPPFETVKAAVKQKKIETELARLKQGLIARHPVRIEPQALAGFGGSPRF